MKSNTASPILEIVCMVEETIIKVINQTEEFNGMQKDIIYKIILMTLMRRFVLSVSTQDTYKQILADINHQMLEDLDEIFKSSIFKNKR